MARWARFGTALIGLALVGASCSGSGSAPTSSTLLITTMPDPTTSTAPTTTTASSTTSSSTTTTLPPGLVPQVLAFTNEPHRYFDYDATGVAKIEVRLVEALGGVFEDLDDQTTLRMILEGSVRRVVLERDEAGVVEIVSDFVPESGELSGELGTFSFSQPLDDWELAAADGTSLPVVVDEAGNRVDLPTGAPTYFALGRSLTGAWLHLAPPFTGEAVDVGDRWEVALDAPVIGSVAFEAEVVGEVETDDGFAFEIAYTGTPVGLPLELGAGDTTTTLSEWVGFGVIDALVALGESADRFEVMVSGFDVSGRYLFDPESGVTLEEDAALDVEETLLIEVGEESASARLSLHLSTGLVLAETEAGRPHQIRSVLGAFAPDPRALSDRSLDPLLAYKFRDIGDEELDAIFEVMDQTRLDLFAGYSYGGVTMPDGETAIAFAIINGGELRGAPFLAESLAWLWAGYRPAAVGIDGANAAAYRVRIGGDEWLVWNGDTVTFVVIASRTAQRELMEALVAGIDEYRWRTGDCLDFSDDFDSAVPYSPFGAHGLRHCEAPHAWEVIFSRELEQGPEERWTTETIEGIHLDCGDAYFEMFDRPPLDLGLEVITYVPDAAEWDRGARYGACVVGVGGRVGMEIRIGRVAGYEPAEAPDITIGTCLAGEQLGAVAVPCELAHRSEVIAVEEYPATDGDAFPGFEAISDHLDEVCRQALDDYPLADGPFDVDFSWAADLMLGWNHGFRTFTCLAFAIDEDGTAANVAGEFSGVWGSAAEQVDA